MSSSVIVGEACPFSQAVEEAVALGLMEEDPASDFNNEYSSRCLMILARELGLERSTTSIDIQKGSDKLVDPTSIDFKNISQKIDNEVHERVESARQKGCVLRQIASVDVIQDEVQMRLVEVPNSHVFAVTPPSCACMRFFTMRHRRYPLIIQGPSAGADSTASALLAEFLSHMRSKVGPQGGRLSRANSMTALSAQRLDT
jgi:aspartokinase/homoserine dehydrogenase 1